MQLSPLLVALCCIVCYVIISFAVARWKSWSTRSKLGCQPIPEFPGSSEGVLKQKPAAFQDVTTNQVGMDRFEKCGTSTYQRQSYSETVVFTSDPLNSQTILQTKFNDWIKDDNRGGASLFFGNGLLSVNGEAWRHSRDLVNPLFKRAELSNIEDFDRYVQRMIALMPRDGRPIDMTPLLRKLFLDSCTEFIFGESIDSLRDTTGRGSDFIDAFNRAIAGAGKRTMALNGVPFFPSFDRSWQRDCKVVHDFIDTCIARHRAADSDTSTSSSQDRKRYVLIDGMSKAIPDPIDLRFQLLNIFSPARETIAMAASNMLFTLARNPSAWTQLRKEALALGDRPLTYDQLRSLSLFRNTVYECFRLHCPVTKTRRVAARDTILPHGGGPDGSSPAFVPKGATVYIDNFPMWRDEQVWGNDVEAFRPSRFQDRPLNWKFAPFFGGPRICPANQQVFVQCIYLLLRLVQEFEMIENRDECLEFIEDIRMCYESRNGCKVALIPAKDR